MPPTKRIRTSLTERACLECQKRKTKCILTGPGIDAQSCAYCSKVGKTCVFVEPSQRTPLTRQNLDDAEARCVQLEALLQQHREANDAAKVTTKDKSPATSVTRPQSATLSRKRPFEWTEAHDEVSEYDRDDDYGGVQDGMAALGDSSKGSGYLGGSSGHEMLQSVSSLLPDPGKIAGATLATPTSSSGHDYMGANFMISGCLSSSAIEDQLVNAYFVGYNAYYAVLHEESFRSQCSRRRSIPQRSSWHIVYYAVLAIGEWVSGCGGNESYSLYHDAARARLTPEVLEAGSMDTVQAFLLLGNYLQKRDRPNTGYNYIGIALRMAMGLGLHRELPPSSEASQMERHRRRILFWLLYAIDCWFNITTGRPALLSDTSYDVKIPRNVDETNCPLPSDSASDAAYPTTCSLTIALARLTKIANRIYSQFMCGSLAPDGISHQTTVMEQMLHDWHAALPHYFTSTESPEWFLGPRQTILWKKANLTILLLLSSQKHQNDEHERLAIGTRCSKVASAAIDDIASFCQHRSRTLHRGLTWYAVYFMLQATLSLSAQFLYRYRSPSAWHNDDWRAFDETLAKAIQCLQQLSPQSPAAARSLRLVAQLYEKAKESVLKTACAQPSPVRAQGVIMQATQVPAALNSIDWASQAIEPVPSINHLGGNMDQAGYNMNFDDFGMGMHLPPNSEMLLPDVMLDDWANAVDGSIYSFLNGLDANFDQSC